MIHQPSYSVLNRWVEDGLLDALDDLGVGCIAFSPLAQGLLTDRYLHGVPQDSRALNDIAEQRGQTLAQLAIAWVLRDPRVTSALIGASSVTQLESSLAAVEAPDFSDDELAAIDKHSVNGEINLWEGPSTA